jgi:hypothetical protein
MTNQKKPNVASRTLQFTKIVAAIAQYITAAVVLGGKSITPPALSALFQAYLQAEQDLEAARTVVTTKMQARDAALTAATAAIPGLRSYLAATYGEQSATYAAFALPVDKAATRTAAEKAASAAKAKATRAAHKAALAKPAAEPAPAMPAAAPVTK